MQNILLKFTYKSTYFKHLTIAVYFLVFLLLVSCENRLLVRGVSMEPSLYDGQKISISKFDEIKKNDVVVFKAKQSDDLMIKRCIALPGENINVALKNHFYPKKGYKIKTYKLNYNDIIQILNINILQAGEIREIEPSTYIVSLSDKDLQVMYSLDSMLVTKEVKDLAVTDSILNKDYYFLVGDNQLNSHDSRHFGPIHITKIIGVVKLKD